jgi:hypothetical protein
MNYVSDADLINRKRKIVGAFRELFVYVSGSAWVVLSAYGMSTARWSCLTI